MTQNDTSVYNIAITISLIILTFCSFFWAVYSLDKYIEISNNFRARSFKPVMAQIVKCYLVEDFAKGKDKSQAQNAHTYGLYPRLIVKYNVEGKEYIADSRLNLIKNGIGDIDSALNRLQKIAPGQTFTYQQNQNDYFSTYYARALQKYTIKNNNHLNKFEIRYNPKKPEEVNIALEKKGDWVAVILGIIFMIPIVIMLWYFFKHTSNSWLFLPSIAGVLLVSFYLAKFLHNFQYNRFPKIRPCMSIDINESFTPKNFMKYIDSVDRDNWKEDSAVQN